MVSDSRTAREASGLDYLESLARERGLATYRGRVKSGSRFSVYSWYLTVEIKGGGTGRTAVLLDFPTRPGKDPDPGLTLALAATILDTALARSDGPTIDLVLLGGQFPETPPYGLEAWLSTIWKGRPDQVLMVQAPQLSKSFNLRFYHSGKGFPSTVLSELAGLDAGGMRLELDTAAFLLDHLKVAPSRAMAPFYAEELPVLRLTAGPSEAEADGRAMAEAVVALAGHIARESHDGKHFVVLWTEPLVMIGEPGLVVSILVVFLFWLVLAWIKRRDIARALVSLFHHLPWMILFMVLAALSAVAGWALTAGIGSIDNAGEWWRLNAGAGVLIQAAAGSAVFILLYGLWTGSFLPRSSKAFGALAHLLAWVLCLGLLVLDLSLAPWALPLIFLTMPGREGAHRGLGVARLLALLAMMLLMVFLLDNYPTGKALLREIRDSLLWASLLIGPAVMLLTALVLALRHHVHGSRTTRLRRLHIIAGGGGVALLSLGAWILSLVLVPASTAEIEVLYDETGEGDRAQMVLTSNVDLGGLSLTFGGEQRALPGKTAFEAEVPRPVKNILCRIDERSFLDRTVVRLELEGLPTALNMSLGLTGTTSLEIINATQPWQYLSPNALIFLLGPYPPETMELSFELPKGTSAELGLNWTSDSLEGLEISGSRPVQFKVTAQHHRHLGSLGAGD